MSSSRVSRMLAAVPLNRRWLLVLLATATLAIAATTVLSTSGSAAPAEKAPAGPRLLDVRYLDRPLASESSHGPGATLVVKAIDPDGQIVSIGYEIRGLTGGHADGGCGLGGKSTGDRETWRLPVRRLVPGRHSISITLNSSSCGSADRIEKSTVTRRIDVSPWRGTPPPAYATGEVAPRRLFTGSSCWKTGKRGVCALREDRPGPIVRSAPGGRIRFELGFEPNDVRLEVGHRTIHLRPQAATTGRKVSGTVSFTLHAKAPRGDVAYHGRIRVKR